MIRKILNVYKSYFSFSGRTSRGDFWLFQLWCILCIIIIDVVAIKFVEIPNNLSNNSEMSPVELALVGAVFFLIILPNISLIVRRLHDANHGGGFFFLMFATCIGAFVVFIFLCQAGTNGPNDYGEVPKEDPNEELHDLLSGLITQWRNINPDVKVKESINVEKVAKSIIKYDQEHGGNTILSDKMAEILNKLV